MITNISISPGTGYDYTPIGTIPEGFRAKGQLYFPVVFDKSIGMGFIDSNGTVQILPPGVFTAGRKDIHFTISYLTQ